MSPPRLPRAGAGVRGAVGPALPALRSGSSSRKRVSPGRTHTQVSRGQPHGREETSAGPQNTQRVLYSTPQKLFIFLFGPPTPLVKLVFVDLVFGESFVRRRHVCGAAALRFVPAVGHRWVLHTPVGMGGANLYKTFNIIIFLKETFFKRCY